MGQFLTQFFKGSEKLIPAALIFVYCVALFDCCIDNPVSKELWNFSMLFLAIFIASTDSSASLIFAFRSFLSFPLATSSCNLSSTKPFSISMMF